MVGIRGGLLCDILLQMWDADARCRKSPEMISGCLWQPDIDPGKDGVHVLVVGVGEYEAGLPPISGANHSAARAAMWWAKAGDKLLENQKLASIQVLISAETRPVIEMPDRSLLEPGIPTRTAVVSAFHRWMELGKVGALAVVHWIGHGALVGVSGERIQHALFCHDVDPVSRLPAALDWTLTRYEIDDVLGERAMCFIDTCRNTRSDLTLPFLHGPWVREWPGRARKSYIYYGAAAGDQTPCKDVKVLAAQYPSSDAIESWQRTRGRFSAGSVFTEAMLCALDGIGAEAIDESLGPAVYEHRIPDILAHRIRLWARHHATDFNGWELTPTSDSPACWQDRPLLRAPNPASNVTIRLPNTKGVANLRFGPIDLGGAVHRDAYFTAEGWNLDVDHGDYTVTAIGKVPVGDEEKTFEGSFHAIHLKHSVDLKEKERR